MSPQDILTAASATEGDRSTAVPRRWQRDTRHLLVPVWLLVALISLGLCLAGAPVRFDEVRQQYIGQTGLGLQRTASGEIVLSPSWTGPAAQAGILDGDVLVAVNGRSMNRHHNVSSQSVLPKGQAGTRLVLSVRTGNFPVRRVMILRHGVDGEALAGLGLSPDTIALYAVVVDIACTIVFLAIAAVLVWRRAGDWLAMLVSLMLVMVFVGVSFPVVSLYREYASLQPVLDIWITLAFASLCAFFYLFPDGRPVPVWTVGLLTILGIWIVGQPLRSNLYPWKLDPVLFLLFICGWLVTGIVAQVVRFRFHANAVQQQQTKWVVFGSVAAVVGLLVFTWHLTWPGQTGASDVGYDLVGLPASRFLEALLPVSISIAVLRYRLWDIDLIINRTLVFGSLTGGVAGLYVLIVAGLSSVLPAQGNLIVSLLATSVIALLFQPARQRLQVAVNHLMYGERDEPYTVLSRLSQRLGGALVPDALLNTIVQTVAEALKLPYAAITVEHNGAFSLEVAYGLPSPDPLVLPLRHHRQSVGQLILGPRAPGDAFSATDRRLLDDLARETGAAVHAMLLTLDLQRSRERLVTEREEERRRVSSDLHDGLGPTLASVMLKLGTIRRQVVPESDAYALLTEVRSDVQGAVDDIRRLARALRPPVLDELGLAQAIHHQAAAYSGGDLTVVVTTPEHLPPLPAAIEVAAYRITLEALTNVVRHAHARNCHIHLAIETVPEEQALIVEVADDGRGPIVESRDGIGIRSMHERAIEVGGSVTVEERAQSGTLVHARIPIPSKGTR